MKKFFSLRNILLGVVAVILLGVAVLFYAVHLLNQKVNSPEFKSTIETNIVNATHINVSIGKLSGHIGFKPWVAAEKIEMTFPFKRVSLDVGQMQIHLKIWPLLRGTIALSEFHLVHPLVTVRRSKDGSWPSSEKNPAAEKQGSRKFTSDKIVIENARILFIDEVVSTEPVLTLNFDASLTHSLLSAVRVMDLKGRFTGVRGSGAIVATGPVWPDVDVSISAKAFPLDYISAYVQQLTPITGAIDLNARVRQDDGPLTWTLNAAVRNPMWATSQFPIPVTLRGVCESTGSLSVNMAWRSTSTVVNASLFAPRWGNPNIFVRWRGEKADVSEITAAVNMFVSSAVASSAPAPTKAAAWSVRGDLDQKNVLVGPVTIPRLSGTVFLAPRSKENSRFNLEWDHGKLDGEILFPRSRGGVTQIEARANVNDIDLALYPELNRRFNVTRGTMSAQVAWRGSYTESPSFGLFSEHSSWDIQAKAAGLNWHGFPVDEIRGDFAWDQHTFSGINITGNASSGTLLGKFSMSGHSPAGFESFSANATVRDVEMGPVFFAFSSNPVILSGRLSSDVHLTGSAQSGHLEKLNGNVSVAGRSGFFRKGKVLSDVFANLNLGSLFKTANERRQVGLPFDVIAATASVRNGRLYFETPAVVKSPVLEMMFTGWMNADFESGEGTLIINALVGSRNFLQAIPGVKQLVVGEDGEFLPLIVDLKVTPGKIEKNFRSIKTLAAPVVEVIGNIIRLPATLFGKGTKKP